VTFVHYTPLVVIFSSSVFFCPLSLRLQQEQVRNYTYNVFTYLFTKNEILDSRLLTKEIIKVEIKTQTWTGSVGTHPSDYLVARALVPIYLPLLIIAPLLMIVINRTNPNHHTQNIVQTPTYVHSDPYVFLHIAFPELLYRTILASPFIIYCLYCMHFCCYAFHVHPFHW
jgi:hypothetical protein